MDLDEYIWRTKKSSQEIAKTLECSPNTIGKIKAKKSSPCLLTAIKLTKISEGQIDLTGLLSKEDLESYKKWVYEKTNK